MFTSLQNPLALIFGFGTRLAALALAFFTLVASFFFHAFWDLPADKQMMQQLMFFKNVGVTGGLLALAAVGAGGWETLAAASAIIFGSPTYMAGPSWQFKKFADASSKPWFSQAWKDKLFAGF